MTNVVMNNVIMSIVVMTNTVAPEREKTGKVSQSETTAKYSGHA